MFNFIKNKFAFIVGISVLTLALLIAGAVILYKDNSKIFEDEGYIIATTKKKNNKYYFSPNTKYKENVDNEITFKDSDSKTVTVSPENFVHYQNGSLSFLTNGALLNLSEINSSALNYYNVDEEDIITYKNNNYVVKSNKGDVKIESLMGRISDNKYIIAGKDLSLKLPNEQEKIAGNYFEILFIENGIVKIDTQEASYQVTAQNSMVYVGDNIVIELGTGKIFYNGEAKMLMSQLTINGDENIDIDTPDKKESESGSGSAGANGSGDGQGGTITDNTDPNNNPQGNGENGETGDGTGEGGNGNGTEGATQTAQVELIEANVTSTSIDLSFQLNNSSAIKGRLVGTLTNVHSNTKELEKEIELKNGTFKLGKESLSPDTEYTLTITEIGSKSEKQYFQKTFKTNDLGITLEKEYATSRSLAYSVKFNENSDVEKVKIVLFNKDGERQPNNEFIISKEDISKIREFGPLLSNTNYSVKVESIWIRNIEYSDVYTINRIDTTLKQTPILSDIKVTANAEEVKFNIKVNNIKDPDKSIVSYQYNIYKAEDITLDTPDPNPVYTVTKNDSDELILDLNEIAELKTGVDYRCKVIALYDDNTMIRESASDYSANFLIKSKPKIVWTTESTSINRVTGTLKLTDGNCSVPIPGRRCLNKTNNLRIRYYKLGENENADQEQTIYLNPESLSTNLTIQGLSSNTTYAVKLYGTYYDDDEQEHPNVQIGDIVYIKTDVSENLKFKVIKDNISGVEEGNNNINTAPVVTFDAKLEAPEDSTISDEVSSITFNLYSGSYNVENKLIGTYVMTEKATIKDFFNNFTITNKLFTNPERGTINTVEKLIALTNNQTRTLNGTYTVEIAKVLDSAGVNEIFVEDNVYTFKLTPSYYLDVRVNTTSSKFVTVTPIKNKSLTEEERAELKRKVPNIDDLNEDTIVGVIVENTLSDAFVDSAYTYEKVIVDYVVFNQTTNKEIKRVSVDMGNKYQPKSNTIYLDKTEDDDNGETTFTRGYNYLIGYELKFTTEDGSNPTYQNEKLKTTQLEGQSARLAINIPKQSEIYTQYISSSTQNSITYRYKISDIDNAIDNTKIYYCYSDDEANKIESTESLVLDNNSHDITLPIAETKEYKIFFKEKGTNSAYREVDKYVFDSDHNYDNQNAFEIVNDNDNTLKIKILDNEITNRAATYKLTIKDKSGSLGDYIRFFLASQLTTKDVDTGEVDEGGNPIIRKEKYISLDYARINEYMKHDLEVKVESYYDSGLVGFNQQFTNGMILFNRVNYLNIYNGNANVKKNEEEKVLNGIYMFNYEYEQDSDTMALFNYLQATDIYNPLNGTSFYDLNSINRLIGYNYQLIYTNKGIIFKNGTKEFAGYNAKVVKTANLNTTNNQYRFESITPKVSITSNNTINSLKIKVNSTGVYGQFIKSGQEHNVFYIDVYSNSDLSQASHIKTLTSNITVTDNQAESEEVELSNLTPNTTYYVTVSAYLEGQLTRLYDMDSSKGYVLKTYESKTLDANTILQKITFHVTPKEYNNASSNKNLLWKLNFKNTENFKVRFELYDINDNPVKFDGSAGTSCNIETIGTEANDYMPNCYIQIGKDEINDIKGKEINHIFTGDNFVFGGEYYKLKVYAIPYTNNAYKEEDKIILYENDSLTSTPGDQGITGKPIHNIKIPFLEEARFDLNGSLISGTRCITEKDSEGNTIYNGETPVCDQTAPSTSVEYFIELISNVIDNSKVVKYGTYTVKLKNDKNEVVSTKTNVSASTINKRITFSGLEANALYYVELSYETYRNNVGFTEAQKVATIPFTDFIYTPIDAGITLGTITATQNNNKKITLTYNGAYNMINNIKKVSYTISLKGGSSNATGTYEITSEQPNIFTVTSDKTPKLLIDLEQSSDENFTLKGGNTYIIITEYWYKNENNQYVQITDHNTNNNKFTTILNL